MSKSKQHITIHDIARELGLSASTVSRALNNNSRISESTRRLVFDLAEKYNYRPNSIAASLRNGKGNTVGVIVPNINRSFFSNIIGGIEEALSASGYNLMICQSHESLEKEKNALATLLDARVDAILMSLSMESTSYEHINELLRKGVKMVFFDRVPMQLAVHSVIIHDYASAYKISKHLLKKGCKRLAHVGGSSSINVYAERLRGFTDALIDTGFEPAKDYIVETDMTLQGGKKALAQLMQLSEPPDGIMCAGDFTAMGIIEQARELGISIPGDLLVSGFANEDFTAFVSPSISTVDQQGKLIGKKVAERFLSIEADPHLKNIVIEPELIFRQSTKDIH